MAIREIKLYKVTEKVIDSEKVNVFVFEKNGTYFGLTENEMIQMRDLLDSTLLRCAVDSNIK